MYVPTGSNQWRTLDSYALLPERIQDAPPGFWQRMRFLGPGFILSASIVGSGELIATTRLGAEAGWTTLWVILLSCLVKVAVQLEFGRHAIYSGTTTMAALNALPGPRMGRANWSVWLWLLLMTVKLLQVGGIVGGTALVLAMVFPGVPLWLLCYSTAVVVSLIIFRGHYQPVEKIALVFIALFTVLTIICVVAVQSTPYAITGSDLISGLSLRLPPHTVIIAIGAFGITGVGGDEIMAYNYWLQEKGYAAFAGKRDDSSAWAARARGWIKVMILDALLSMVIYTVMTAAFYLLGAAILHKQGLLPEGMALVETLSVMYTESLGPWAGTLFTAGAFVVLFSTLFGALALWTRLFADAFAQVGWLNFHNVKQRRRAIGLIAWIVPIIWASLFLLVKLPAQMVIIGGVAGTGILLIVVVAVVHFRYFEAPAVLNVSRAYDLALWVSIMVIALIAAYGLWQVFR